MSSKDHPEPHLRCPRSATLLMGRSGPREEGCGGPFDGTTQGGDQGDAQALRQGLEGREGPVTRRAVHPDRVEPPARPAVADGGRTGHDGAPERPRQRGYGPEVLPALRLVWAVLDGPSGKRLAPFMAEIVEALERWGELEASPQVRDKLLRISSASIDRMLAPERVRLRVKGRSGTKPGSMLKRQIPIRTFAEWNEDRPGFCEVDLVGHDGGNPAGEFCQTLDLTCVRTGWTEPRAIKTKAQR